MPDSVTAGWFPVLTLLIGFGTKYLADWAQDRRTAKRAEEIRKTERLDKLVERQAEFQRPALLELQGAVLRMARATAQIHLHDKKSGQWGKPGIPADLDESLRSESACTTMLIARIRDDLVRDLGQKLKDCCTAVTLSKTEQDSERAMTAMAAALPLLNERIGVVLRNLDDFETQVSAGR
jgi:hypothetical protein